MTLLIRSGRARRGVAVLAALVFLLGALAPTVSRAVASMRTTLPPSLSDICSTAPRTTGPRVAPAADILPLLFPRAPSKPAHAHLDHCPFCLLIAERLGPSSSCSLHFFWVDSISVRPDEQALSFVALTVSITRARGPPRTPDDSSASVQRR